MEYRSSTELFGLPPPSSIVPFVPIPHAPFRWSDAGWFALIVWALLLVAGAVQARRNR
jgi:hypothetical protein